jgi:hypothetical protein
MNNLDPSAPPAREPRPLGSRRRTEDARMLTLLRRGALALMLFGLCWIVWGIFRCARWSLLRISQPSDARA